MKDLRAVGFCSRGARAVFKKGDLDWQKFLDEGMDTKDCIGKVDPYFLEKLEEQNGR